MSDISRRAFLRGVVGGTAAALCPIPLATMNTLPNLFRNGDEFVPVGPYIRGSGYCSTSTFRLTKKGSQTGYKLR